MNEQVAELRRESRENSLQLVLENHYGNRHREENWNIFFYKKLFFRDPKKYSVKIVLRIVLNVYIALSRMAIFILLILLIHKHGNISIFLISFSISLFNVLKFSSNKSSTCLNSYSKKFYNFEANVQCIFHISFSVYLSFVHRKTTFVT